MIRTTSRAFAALLALGFSLPAHAETVVTVTIEKILTGPTLQGGNDQVWLRVAGQPANVPADCVWTGNPYSFFYLSDDSVLNRSRALAMLMSAKASNQPITISFDVGANYADFGGFGYAKCILRKVVLG